MLDILIGDYIVSVEILYYSAYVPAKIYGPPEYCCEEEPSELDYIVTSVSLDGKQLGRSEQECFLAVYEQDVYDAVLKRIEFERTASEENWD